MDTNELRNFGEGASLSTLNKTKELAKQNCPCVLSKKKNPTSGDGRNPVNIYVFLFNGWQIIKLRAYSENEAFAQLTPAQQRGVELIDQYQLIGRWLLKGPWKILSK